VTRQACLITTTLLPSAHQMPALGAKMPNLANGECYAEGGEWDSKRLNERMNARPACSYFEQRLVLCTKVLMLSAFGDYWFRF